MKPSRQGILLVNLGTPDAPTPGAVWRYLAEFLRDRRVVELPPAFWWPLRFGLVLPLRCRRVAANYAKIWLPDGSPLRVYTQRQAAALEAELGLPAIAAFRYGKPDLESGLATLEARGCEEIIALPLYPQYSATTTATALDALSARLKARRRQPGLQWIRDYRCHPGYISALAASVRQHWDEHGRGERLLLSFHGLPEVNITKGDPYQQHCEDTAAALARELDLGADAWALSYQSRFGKQRWLEPATTTTVEEWGRQGVATVDVICPGFAADCLETLEEIRLEAAADFQAAGGRSLRYIPALNDNPAHIAALADLLRPRLHSPTT